MVLGTELKIPAMVTNQPQYVSVYRSANAGCRAIRPGVSSAPPAPERDFHAPYVLVR